ncbi:hypothetical protein GCG54_00001566 [Colletotrichum gloeosporioides]|uniref:Uncharacterized protein n=1 Tax=Colletotrichum gloeosporioides TaxID=474922 RepID=A0A8H4FQZ6_COLGL|nr:uncharacterized protein GCG54_00001566 [Colletotrichum gloeosporioides]KAF3811250.1 hypothetical protein GCG54_00001566 [Colletotrichum gloeosporioides]
MGSQENRINQEGKCPQPRTQRDSDIGSPGNIQRRCCCDTYYWIPVLVDRLAVYRTERPRRLGA